MRLQYVTFLDAIPSPKTTNTNTTYGRDPASFNGGYVLEVKGDWIHITWPGKNKDGIEDCTEVVHASRVRNARLLPEDMGPGIAKVTPQQQVTRR